MHRRTFLQLLTVVPGVTLLPRLSEAEVHHGWVFTGSLKAGGPVQVFRDRPNSPHVRRVTFSQAPKWETLQYQVRGRVVAWEQYCWGSLAGDGYREGSHYQHGGVEYREDGARVYHMHV